MDSQEQSLLEELKLGKESALKRLFDQYYMPLCLYSIQITDSFELSEDIVQDFFIAFWEKRIYNHISENLRGYLFFSVRNASMAVVKKEKIIFLAEVEKEAYSLPDDSYDEEELLQRQKRLQEELRELPVQGLKIFEAIVLQEKKYKEVAEELNISVNSVKTHLSRALKQLRTSLDMKSLDFIILLIITFP